MSTIQLHGHRYFGKARNIQTSKGYTGHPFGFGVRATGLLLSVIPIVVVAPTTLIQVFQDGGIPRVEHGGQRLIIRVAAVLRTIVVRSTAVVVVAGAAGYHSLLWCGCCFILMKD